ncbi:MAG: tetratricopeptide repeat protein [Alphaproteobacteria bacterium]
MSSTHNRSARRKGKAAAPVRNVAPPPPPPSPPPSSTPSGTFTIEQAFNIAVERHVAGDTTSAAAIYRQILAVRPAHPETLHNLGLLEMQAGRTTEAEDLFRRSLEARPGYLAAMKSLAAILVGTARGPEAETLYGEILNANPDDHDCLNALGRQRFERNDPEAAVALFERAAALSPTNGEYQTNLGAMCRIVGRFQQSAQALRRAVQIQPASAESWSNLSSTLKMLGGFDEAMACIRRAGRVNPSFAAARWNESLTLLLQGAYEEGWKLYDWRWKTAGFPSPIRQFPQPAWQGEDLSGRRLLVHWEQGFGDTLQFARYLPLLKARGATIIFESQKALLRLFRGLEGVDELVEVATPLPPFDVYVALMSIPALVGTTLATIPAKVPYLTADQALRTEWFDRLGWNKEVDGTRPLRVGLVWAGSDTHGDDRFRSPGLAALTGLLTVPGTRFYSLQFGPRRDDMQAVASFLNTHPMPDLGGSFADFADTAAVVSGLDLVISIDTSVVHLAGALGKPVWMLTPFAPDWRWLLGRNDSPWYPNQRLYRQPAPGPAWADVIARIRNDLLILARKTGGAGYERT